MFYPYKDHGKWDDVQCGGDNPISEFLLEKHYFICQFRKFSSLLAFSYIKIVVKS